MNINRNFFDRKPAVVAQELLGKILVRKKEGKILAGWIVETEAYLGPGDKASHSHRGMTKRNEVMFGPAGFSYVYFTYGMHWLLNLITEKEGKASGVLIRALEPIADQNLKIENCELKISECKIASGPAKLTKWLEVDCDLNKVDITKSEELFVTNELVVTGVKYQSKRITKKDIVATTRVGVDYAGDHKDLPLRFYIKDSKYISRA